MSLQVPEKTVYLLNVDTGHFPPSALKAPS
jgi:hypothetical protein